MKVVAEAGQAVNRLLIAGTILERKVLRYTPAGVPVSEATLHHVSEVVEAGVVRRIEMEIPLRAIGESSRWLESAELGSRVEIDGFLAPKSLKSRATVLHVNSLRFI